MPSTNSGQSNDYGCQGKAIYDRSIRNYVEREHTGDFVAIDVDSGAWEVDADDYTATERLLASRPQARIWLMRVGSSSAYKIGGSRRDRGT